MAQEFLPPTDTQEPGIYPLARMDFLTDGIFAVAMTILVLDIKLPDDFQPADNAAMTQALLALWPKFFPYLLSFYLLGVNWLSTIKAKSHSETRGHHFAKWWLIYLVLVTLIPFSTLLMGQHPGFPISTVVYSGNIGLMAFAGYRMLALAPQPVVDQQWLDRKVSLLILLATCAATMALTLVWPGKALFVMAFNALASPLARRYASDRNAATSIR